MDILKLLPEFKVVEMNRSTGLTAGHVVSQFVLNPASTLINKVNEGAENEFHVIENGFIVGLDRDLIVDKYNSSTHGQPFLVFTEELNRLFSGLKWYATEEDADGDIYPRLVALYVGDAFTTNNYDEDSTTDPKFAKVVNGVLTLQDSGDSDTMFAVEESTLPDGSDAMRFIYIG